MNKVAVVTATRAEYGLLVPLIKRISDDEELELDLIVTGTHLSRKHGYTISTIIDDGFPISHKIDILEPDNTAYGVSLSMANAIIGFARCFEEDRPDLVVILGDRTEMLGVASAAMNERVPIVHIHGGELTEGAIDDCVRHAITKMSYLHFTSCEEYRRRVIQMGEHPNRVFNVGALGVENILNMELMTEVETRGSIGIPEKMPYALMTYHPETTKEMKLLEKQILILCDVIRECKGLFFVVTGANADAGGNVINDTFEFFCKNCSNASFIKSLGTHKYLSAIKYARFVIGNSSSGILEAPVLGTLTINIGDRQKGRLRSETIVDCACKENEILRCIEQISSMARVRTNLYGDGHTSERMVAILKDAIYNDEVSVEKVFYDI